MERCGSEPIRFRLPITGHGLGPGGRLYLYLRRLRVVEELRRLLRQRTVTRTTAAASTAPREEEEAHGGSSSSSIGTCRVVVVVDWNVDEFCVEMWVHCLE
jgi:hypothetical protein